VSRTFPASLLRPATVPEVQEAVLYAAPGVGPTTRVRPVAGRSKTALHHPGDGVVVDLAALAGITEYQPDECTFTALAGTPIAEIDARLAAHGQSLPFEPPFAARGATLGGTVASGLNGPGRYHHGGVRDFLIGAQFVDGEGRLVRGGGKVVKNAAGFYLHHLLLGSLGRLGIFVELTFKVFPVPRAQRTLRVRCASLADALAALDRVRRSTTDPDALELTADGEVLVRVAGAADAIAPRVDGLAAVLGHDRATVVEPPSALAAADAEAWWAASRELAWASTQPIAKVAVTPSRILALDAGLARAGAGRRYGAGGEVAWVAWPGEWAALDALLLEHGLSGVTLVGPAPADPMLGVRPDDAFLARVRQTIDPRGTFRG
jgi:glycolate oxidase FAD binding subunit